MKRRTFICGCCGLTIGCAFTSIVAKQIAKDKIGKMIAACGLVCTDCDMFKLPIDKAVQDKIIPYFKRKTLLKENEGIETIIEKGMYCKGCNVDKEVFWSKECKIAACCKDVRMLENCSQCPKFPCPKLKELSKRGGKYLDAFNDLVSLKGKG
jgi:hypothetical protein